jgi:hypothetical protein
MTKSSRPRQDSANAAVNRRVGRQPRAYSLSASGDVRCVVDLHRGVGTSGVRFELRLMQGEQMLTSEIFPNEATALAAARVLRLQCLGVADSQPD